MAPIRFGVVGSGWRAEFFVRMARLMPERFQCVGVVTRSAERGAEVERRGACRRSARSRSWSPRVGPTHRTARSSSSSPCRGPSRPDAIRELVDAGHPGARRDAARARRRRAARAVGRRRLVGTRPGGRAQPVDAVARGPDRGRRRRADRRGRRACRSRSTHLYHAVGLIRRLLGAGRGEVDRAGVDVHRARCSSPLAPRRLDRRHRARRRVEHPRHARLRRRPQRAVRLHRQPVAQPAAHQPDRRPRLARRDRRRHRHALGRRAHGGQRRRSSAA